MAHGNEKVGSFTGDSKSYDSHTEECSGTMTNKDLLIRKLKADLEHARRQQQETSRELRDSEMTVARIQGQLGKMQDEHSLRRSDVAAKEHNIRTLEQQYRGNKLEVHSVIMCQQQLLFYRIQILPLETMVSYYKRSSPKIEASLTDVLFYLLHFLCRLPGVRR